MRVFECDSCKKEYDLNKLDRARRYFWKFKNDPEQHTFTCLYCAAIADDRAFDHIQETKKWVELSNQYPRIFNTFKGRDIFGEEVLFPSPVAGGVGDGWFEIVKEACEKIQEELDRIGPKSYCNFFQMKEKFGGLRWYTTMPEKKNPYRKFVYWWNYKVMAPHRYLPGKLKLWKFMRLPRGRSRIENILWEAEEKSYKTCELCGDPGQLRTGGWHLTLCDKHAKERGYID